MKVAVVCDWLVVYAGAERVLEQILRIYPEADVFCLVDFISAEKRGFLLNKKNAYQLYTESAQGKKQISLLSATYAAGY